MQKDMQTTPKRKANPGEASERPVKNTKGNKMAPRSSRPETKTNHPSTAESTNGTLAVKDGADRPKPRVASGVKTAMPPPTYANPTVSSIAKASASVKAPQGPAKPTTFSVDKQKAPANTSRPRASQTPKKPELAPAAPKGSVRADHEDVSAGPVTPAAGTRPKSVARPRGPGRRQQVDSPHEGTPAKKPKSSTPATDAANHPRELNAPSGPPVRQNPQNPRARNSVWDPTESEEIRAKWAHDKMFHRAKAIHAIPGTDNKRFEVEFVTDPHDNEAEAVRQIVERSDLLHQITLPPPPELGTDELRIEAQTSTEHLKEGTHVLAKKRQEPGHGRWFPGVIDSIDVNANNETFFTVRFLGRGHPLETVDRKNIDPLFNDMPLLYNIRGQPVWPSKKPAPADVIIDEPSDFNPIPNPASLHKNYYGAQGYRSQWVGSKNGEDQFRTIIEWQNTSMQKQSVGKLSLKGPTKRDAQYDHTDGVLDALPSDETKLAQWSDGKGRVVDFKVADIRILWWQYKRKAGAWLMFEAFEGRQESVFSILPRAKGKTLNMVKAMTAKLRKGRTEGSSYTRYVGDAEEEVEEEEQDVSGTSDAPVILESDSEDE